MAEEHCSREHRVGMCNVAIYKHPVESTTPAHRQSAQHSSKAVEPILPVPDGLSARPIDVISLWLLERQALTKGIWHDRIARPLGQNLPTRAILHHS